MFDLGWAEFLIIAAVALFVIGPKDIPAIAYQVGKAFRRLKYMQYALSGQFEDFMQAAETKKEKENPKPEKQELDHDPYDEAEADAELIEMMPLPEKETSLREGEADEEIKKNKSEKNEK
jgi:Tat protein translocase TatB subunit